VVVHGDWLPRHIMLKGHILFAMLRNLWLCLCLLLKCWLKQGPAVDVFFVDQISIGIPLLKLSGTKVYTSP